MARRYRCRTGGVHDLYWPDGPVVRTVRPMTIVEEQTADLHWTGVERTSPWIEAAEEVAATLSTDAAALDESGAFVDEGFALLRTRRLHVDARPERARRRRCDPRRGLRRPGDPGPGLPGHLARALHAHPPHRRTGLAPPPRHARTGAGEGRRQAAGARVDGRVGLDRVERHGHEDRHRIPGVRAQGTGQRCPGRRHRS